MNVRLNSKYNLRTDQNNFILEKVGINKDENSEGFGEETLSGARYYQNLEDVLLAVLKFRLRDTDAITLEALVLEIKDIKEEIRTIMGDLPISDFRR